MSSHLALAAAVSWQDRIDQTLPDRPTPCVVRAEYADGYTGEAIGHALVWTLTAAEVLFVHPDESLTARPQYKTWVPLSWVRRLTPEDGDPPRLIPHDDSPGAPAPEAAAQDRP